MRENIMDNGKKYGKKDLIDQMAEFGELKKKDVAFFLDLFTDTVKNMVQEPGDSLTIRGLVKFEKVILPAREYRNPKTGEYFTKDDTVKTKAKARF